MRTAAWDAWIERARAVRIEDEAIKRGIKLNGDGKNERCGSCPQCGGEDRFSINTKKGVFHCRGCGKGGDVIALVQLIDGTDFVHAVETLTGEPPPKANGKDRADGARKVVAGAYPYHDAAGEVALVVERIEYQNPDGSFVMKGAKRKKTFRQKRPDPDRPGEWIWDTDGVPPLIYLLPEVTEAIAAGHTILIVEGERKAALLWEWGVPATCCPGGAERWKAEHSEFLRGADVVILPDNDLPGRKHVDAVARSLAGIARSVRILELPDLPPKGDIVDWAEAGHTRKQLDALIDWAPDYPAADSMRDAPKTAVEQQGGVRLEDFVAYMPQRSSYFFMPSRDLWPGTSVDARLPPVLGPDEKPIKPSAWLAVNAAVEQTTWAPGEPMLIKNRLVSDAGWIKRPGCSIFNFYRPPALVPRAGDITAWLDLVHKVFPEQADHIVLWLAHRVQRPQEKINHALVLGGKPGIGKDTILEPVKQAIGPWNFADEAPHRVLGGFNSFARSVILRISEARDLGDWDRFAFFERMKALIAAPPDVVRINEKHLREYYIFNLCGVVITTNHKSDGIFLPADDRRHFVAWSSLSNKDFADDYWRRQYRWYASGGNAAVAEYLASRDLSSFDPKAPPPKTEAFWEIANANRAPEDAELADVLDDLERPDVVTLDRVASQASVKQPAFAEWLRDSKANARRIPHRFEDCGYVAVRNPNDSEGRWKIKGRRHTIYGKVTLTENERLDAAFKFTGTR